MSGGLPNSPGWVKPTTGHTSSFEEGQESILEAVNTVDFDIALSRFIHDAMSERDLRCRHDIGLLVGKFVRDYLAAKL